MLARAWAGLCVRETRTVAAKAHGPSSARFSGCFRAIVQNLLRATRRWNAGGVGIAWALASHIQSLRPRLLIGALRLTAACPALLGLGGLPMWAGVGRTLVAGAWPCLISGLPACQLLAHHVQATSDRGFGFLFLLSFFSCLILSLLWRVVGFQSLVFDVATDNVTYVNCLRIYLHHRR